jgi:hypothetical protein
MKNFLKIAALAITACGGMINAQNATPPECTEYTLTAKDHAQLIERVLESIKQNQLGSAQGNVQSQNLEELKKELDTLNGLLRTFIEKQNKTSKTDLAGIGILLLGTGIGVGALSAGIALLRNTALLRSMHSNLIRY